MNILNTRSMGFTLVELIVVITILSILGTIGFTSLGGYSSLARESARITDITTIAKALDLAYLRDNSYPEPGSGTNITYSGSTIWTQGYFDEGVRRKVKRISEVPIEAIVGSPYIYSVTHNSQEYQLAGGLERGDALAINALLPNVDAAFSRAIIKGNYNGAFIGKNIGSDAYIFGVPSIIAKDITSVDILDIVSNQRFVLDGFGPLPNGYSTTDEEAARVVNFSPSDPSDIVLYAGSVEGIGTSQGILSTAQNSYNLYSGTGLQNYESINPYIGLDPNVVENQSEVIKKYARGFLNILSVEVLAQENNLIAILSQISIPVQAPAFCALAGYNEVVSDPTRGLFVSLSPTIERSIRVENETGNIVACDVIRANLSFSSLGTSGTPSCSNVATYSSTMPLIQVRPRGIPPSAGVMRLIDNQDDELIAEFNYDASGVITNITNIQSERIPSSYQSGFLCEESENLSFIGTEPYSVINTSNDAMPISIIRSGSAGLIISSGNSSSSVCAGPGTTGTTFAAGVTYNLARCNTSMAQSLTITSSSNSNLNYVLEF